MKAVGLLWLRTKGLVIFKSVFNKEYIYESLMNGLFFYITTHRNQPSVSFRMFGMKYFLFTTRSQEQIMYVSGRMSLI